MAWDIMFSAVFNGRSLPLLAELTLINFALHLMKILKISGIVGDAL